MDNVTHTAIGVLLAETAARRRPGLRVPLYWASVLGSNAPDLDFLGVRALGGDRLTYFLYHRGYTHSWFGALAIGAVCGFLGHRLGRSRPKDRAFLCSIGVLAALLHIFADSWNDYGIHPFSPLWNKWFYGDAVSIIEPLLLAPLLALAFYSVSGRFYRVLWSLFALTLLALAWASRFLIPAEALGVSVWLMAWAGLFRLIRDPKRRLAVSWAAVAGVLALAFASSRAAERQLVRDAARVFPRERLTQLIMVPLPANPACWKAVATFWVPGSEDGKEGPSLVQRVAEHQVLGGLDNEHCPAQTEWKELFRAAERDFRELVKESCVFSAYLKFSRAPVWETDSRGRLLRLGDLRLQSLSTESRLAMFPAPAECPRWVPRWEEPFRF